jgi:hypothetical protein
MLNRHTARAGLRLRVDARSGDDYSDGEFFKEFLCKGGPAVKWIVLPVLLLVTILVAGISTVPAEDYFRCGPETVSVGDTTGKVFMECGKPTWKESAGYRKGLSESQLWYYNCGSSDYLYVLHFVGGRLKNVESQGYGKGNSDCYGPRR